MYVILTIIVFGLIIGFIIYFSYKSEINKKLFSTKRRRVNLYFAVAYLSALFAITGFLVYYFNKPEESINVNPFEQIQEQKEEAKNEIENIEQKKSEVGDEAPKFELKNLINGKVVKSSDFKASTAMLAFSSTWCKYCVKQLPILKELYAANQKDLKIYMIFFSEDEKTVKEYIDANGIKFPVLIDPDGELIDQYSITGTPSHVFIKNGIICSKKPGYTEKQKLLEAVEACK